MSRRPPTGTWWKLMAVAGAGYATARLLKRQLQQAPALDTSGGSFAEVWADAPEIESPSAVAPTVASALELPSDCQQSWLPGPLGPIHIVQRHVDADFAMLFVHGLGGDHAMWAPALAALSPRWRGIAVDLPGHGRSDGVAGVTLDDLASSLGAVIDGLGLKHVVLVGHSLGASLVIRYAGRNRHRVAGVLLVDPNGDLTGLPKKQRQYLQKAVTRDAHGELEDHFKSVLSPADESIVDRVLASLLATDPKILASTLATTLDYSPLRDLDRFDGPLRMIVSPLNDTPTSLHRLRPKLRIAMVDNVGHWLFLERPDVFAELLASFLDVAADGFERVN